MWTAFFSCTHCHERCHAESFPLCRSCLGFLRPAPDLCPACFQPLASELAHVCLADLENTLIDSCVARYTLVEPGYSVLKTWKKTGGPALDQKVLKAEEAFLDKLTDHWSLQTSHPVLTTIPQKLDRAWQMRRSPARTIASWLSKTFDLPIADDFLELEEPDARSTRRQAEKTLADRMQTPSPFRPSCRALRYLARGPESASIIVVDDFLTTGRTLKNAAVALRLAGFKQVHTFALGFRPYQTEASGASVWSLPTSGREMPAALKAAST